MDKHNEPSGEEYVLYVRVHKKDGGREYFICLLDKFVERMNDHKEYHQHTRTELARSTDVQVLRRMSWSLYSMTNEDKWAVIRDVDYVTYTSQYWWETYGSKEKGMTLLAEKLTREQAKQFVELASDKEE